jgi:hypothetical protein
MGIFDGPGAPVKPRSGRGNLVENMQRAEAKRKRRRERNLRNKGADGDGQSMALHKLEVIASRQDPMRPFIPTIWF